MVTECLLPCGEFSHMNKSPLFSGRVIDLAFPIHATAPIPADHGYAVYGAISRLQPSLHELEGLAIHPIIGMHIGSRQMQVTDRSRLTFRCDAKLIPQAIPLAGKAVHLGDVTVRIGVPEVRLLEPAAALHSRLVTIKMPVASATEITEAMFVKAIQSKLRALNVSEQVIVTLGKRRTVRLKGKEVVGYQVFLQGLSAEESLSVLENGLGGRRRIGCGVFGGWKPRKESTA